MKKFFRLLLMLSLWIIYAKRTAGEKKRTKGNEEKTWSLSLPLYHIQTKLEDKNEKKTRNIYNYAQSTLSFFCFYSIYLLCLSTTDSHFFFFFFSLSPLFCYISNMCDENKKNERRE